MSSYSNIQICIIFSLTETKQNNTLINNMMNRKGNTCENTCIFPNGEYNQAMGNGEYQELWDLNQRSLYD